MKAIVCDLCGKTELLSDDPYRHAPTGFCALVCDRRDEHDFRMDLCEECAGKLIEKARNTRGGGGDG